MTDPDPIAAQRLAKLREAVNVLYGRSAANLNGLWDVAHAARSYLAALDQPAPESNKCWEEKQ